MKALQYERAVQTACLLILTIFAVTTALIWLRPVVVPFVLALFLAVGLTPLVDFQERRLRVPRLVALGSTLVLGVVLIVLLGLLVTTSVDSMLQSSKRYDGDFRQLIEWVENLFGINPDAEISEAANPVNPGPPPGEGGAGAPPGTAETQNSGSPPAEGEDPGWFRPLLLRGVAALELRFEGAMQRVATNVASALLSIVQNGVLVLIFLGFLILGGHGLRQDQGPIWQDIEARIRSYIGTKTLLSAVTGALVGSTLSLLEVELALVFGVLAFLLNFIPSIGSIIACVLPIPVVLTAPDTELGLVAKILAIGIPVLIQFGIGNVLEPKIIGETLQLNPILILLALIFWGMMWGVIGMFLAVPITVAVKIFLERLGIIDMLKLEPAAGAATVAEPAEESDDGSPGEE